MEHESNGEKRPYAKPEIQEVPLRPDEAVLGGCKHGGRRQRPRQLQLPAALGVQLTGIVAPACIFASAVSRSVPRGSDGPQGLRLSPSPAAAPFAVDPCPPDVAIEVEVGIAGDDLTRECLFDSGGPWRLYRDGRRLSVLLLRLEHRRASLQDRALQPDVSRGHVKLDRAFFAGAASVDPLDYPLDELVMIALLSQGRGLEVHGCGVADESGARYLFVGQSGAGSPRWRACGPPKPGVILSDDRIVLRQHGRPLDLRHAVAWRSAARVAGAGAPRPRVLPAPRPRRRAARRRSDRRRRAALRRQLSPLS